MYTVAELNGKLPITQKNRARKEDIPLTANTYENKTVTPTLRLTAVVFFSLFWLERKITLD